MNASLIRVIGPKMASHLTVYLSSSAIYSIDIMVISFIMGADAVLRRRIDVDRVDEKQGAFQEHFDACAGLDADALERCLAPSWNAWSGAGLRYAARIAARALVAIPLELARARRSGGR